MSRRARRFAIAVITVAIALLVFGAGRWRDRMLDTNPMLPLSFAHADHRGVNCITCHHNFTDGTGQGLCIDCHKMDPKIRLQIQPMFHTLCRDCHIEKHAKGEDAGPVRGCVDCHVADDAF
jgi:hypothetical protein